MRNMILMSLTRQDRKQLVFVLEDVKAYSLLVYTLVNECFYCLSHISKPQSSFTVITASGLDTQYPFIATPAIAC